MCKAGSQGHLASKYWLKILAQESSSSDPDVYFSSKPICEQYFKLFTNCLAREQRGMKVISCCALFFCSGSSSSPPAPAPAAG